MYKVDVNQDTDWTKIYTDSLDQCLSNHAVIDSNTLVFTHKDSVGERMYSLNLNSGATPKLLFSAAPSFFQDYIEKEAALLYTATRRKRKALNIYRRPIGDTREVRLTKNRGIDFAADYSPANDMIYLCSTRSGDMKIWETSILGLQRKQLTFDEYQDWSPTVSPDGEQLYFLSYLSESEENNAVQPILLRSLNLKKDNALPEIVLHLYGDYHTLSSASWSADGSKIAFVSYSFPAKQLVVEVNNEQRMDI